MAPECGVQEEFLFELLKNFQNEKPRNVLANLSACPEVNSSIIEQVKNLPVKDGLAVFVRKDVEEFQVEEQVEAMLGVH